MGVLSYGAKALKALPKFFAYRNTFDIYTEDRVADKEFYRTLFKRLLGDAVINDVTPLGCKANVLAAFDSQDMTDRRKKFFIVDGDLDLIIGTNRKSEGNLIVLDSYCIENYVVDETAAIEFLYFSSGVEGRDKISTKLNFRKWLGYNSECLVELFLNFAILRKYGGGPTLKNASEFLTQNSKQTILDKAGVEAYSASIRADILTFLQSKGYSDADVVYEQEILAYRQQWKNDENTLLQIVSGKSYLLPLLQFRLNHCLAKGKSLFKTESLKLFLAGHCDLSRLEFLKKRLEG